MSSRRTRLRITLGALMAFIAGMAVMLGVLLPWLPREMTLSSIVTDPHASISLPPGTSMKNCTACHVSVPRGPSPVARGK